MSKNPFVVLMAEDDKHDILATRRAWEENHIVKPLGFQNFNEAIRINNLFWELVELPE